jgi:predicted transcriptional regulator
MKRGHMLDFGDERVRDFVYDLLKAQDKRLGRSEILNMEVPTEEDVLELMDEYRADEKKIESLEDDAEELQEELDEIILRDVYELDDDDVQVIDEFLEVW